MIVRFEKNGETQMTEFLVTHFIKNHEAVEKVSVRTAYGVLASVVGIFCNVFLFGMKLILGLVLHSVSAVSYTHLPASTLEVPTQPPIMAALAPYRPASGPWARRRPNSMIPSP